MLRKRIEWIGVIGSSSVSGREYEEAVEIGRALGRKGFRIVNGGLGGIMEAVAKGASEEGATVIGILPGSNRSDANEHVIPIVTGIGDMRNALIIRNSDLIVAVFGGYGTLSELAFAMKAEKPVISYRSWKNVVESYKYGKYFDKLKDIIEYIELSL